MGLRVFDFRCGSGHTSEHFVEAETIAVNCPRCNDGTIALKQLSMPRIDLDGCSGDFPTAADKWVQRREAKMKQEQRNQERHGTYD